MRTSLSRRSTLRERARVSEEEGGGGESERERDNDPPRHPAEGDQAVLPTQSGAPRYIRERVRKTRERNREIERNRESERERDRESERERNRYLGVRLIVQVIAAPLTLLCVCVCVCARARHSAQQHQSAPSYHIPRPACPPGRRRRRIQSASPLLRSATPSRPQSAIRVGQRRSGAAAATRSASGQCARGGRLRAGAGVAAAARNVQWRARVVCVRARVNVCASIYVFV